MRTLPIVAVLLALLNAAPAHAVKLWDSWKPTRPFGAGASFAAEMPVMDLGANANLYCIGSPSFTTAPYPCDLDVILHGMLSGHSGRFAKNLDKKEFAISMMVPDSRGVYRVQEIAGQYKRDQEGVPREQRWPGMVSIRVKAGVMPFGRVVFKLDYGYDQDPCFIVLNRTMSTFREMVLLSGGIGVAPAGVLPQGFAPAPQPTQIPLPGMPGLPYGQPIPGVTGENPPGLVPIAVPPPAEMPAVAPPPTPAEIPTGQRLAPAYAPAHEDDGRPEPRRPELGQQVVLQIVAPERLRDYPLHLQLMSEGYWSPPIHITMGGQGEIVATMEENGGRSVTLAVIPPGQPVIVRVPMPKGDIFPFTEKTVSRPNWKHRIDRRDDGSLLMSWLPLIR